MAWSLYGVDSEYLFLMLVDQLQIVLYERKVVTGHWDMLVSSPMLPSDSKILYRARQTLVFTQP